MPRAALVLLLAAPLARAAAPTDNPVAAYKIAWAAKLPWSRVVSIADVKGDTPAAKLAAAQAKLAKKGGVVYFPAGTYRFAEGIVLEDGVILRGEAPKGVTDARKDGYAPATKFVFPRYAPKLSGDGTPITTAFKGITLRRPGTASNCGVVHIDVNFGHVRLLDAGPKDFKAGRNRLVVGCVLRNAAVADPSVPDRKIGQAAWQRFTARHHPAVAVKGENLLVAANRLPPSGDGNFTMKGYVVRAGKKAETLDEVVFDYDNRPGLSVNDYGLGGAGGGGPDGTPMTHPWGFRKGIVIRDNYLYHTGRCAIAFAGDGVVCRGNVIRFKKGVYRPTVTGKDRSRGSSTNDNRAVQMRGWRWAVEENDYEVHRNLAADRKYHINDGEGLMHEDHVNSTVKDSVLRKNKGNTYLSIYKTGGIDGLVVEGNDVADGIYVVADRNKGRHECKNVRVINNVTRGGAIRIAGAPASGNVASGNRSVGKKGKLVNAAKAKVEKNEGYVLAEK